MQQNFHPPDSRIFNSIHSNENPHRKKKEHAWRHHHHRVEKWNSTRHFFWISKAMRMEKVFFCQRDLRRMFTYLRNHRRKKNKKLKRKTWANFHTQGKTFSSAVHFIFASRERVTFGEMYRKRIFFRQCHLIRRILKTFKMNWVEDKKNAAETSTEFDIAWGRMCRRQTGAGRRHWMYTQRNAISRCR